MPYTRRFHLLMVAAISLGASAASPAGSEFVTVEKISSDGDHAIVVRSNGNAYQIQKGIGCLSLSRYEGKKVLVTFPGFFLGIGSELHLPDQNQKCRIWDSKELGPLPGLAAETL